MIAAGVQFLPLPRLRAQSARPGNRIAASIRLVR